MSRALNGAVDSSGSLIERFFISRRHVVDRVKAILDLAFVMAAIAVSFAPELGAIGQVASAGRDALVVTILLYVLGKIGLWLLDIRGQALELDGVVNMLKSQVGLLNSADRGTSRKLLRLEECQGTRAQFMTKAEGEEIVFRQIALNLERDRDAVADLLRRIGEKGTAYTGRITYQVLIFRDDPNKRADSKVSNLSEKTGEDVASQSEQRIKRLISDLRAEFSGREVKFTVEARFYYGIPSIHGFSLKSGSASEVCLAICRWPVHPESENRRDPAYDWGSDRFHRILGPPLVGSADADLLDIFNGHFSYWWQRGEGKDNVELCFPFPKR